MRWRLGILILACGALLILLFRGGRNEPVKGGPGPDAPSQQSGQSSARGDRAGSAAKAPSSRRDLVDPSALKRNPSREGEEAQLTIRVVDRASRKPLEAAVVQASGKSARLAVEVYTDFSGAATLRLRNDDYHIRVEKPGYLPEQLDLGFFSRSIVEREVELTEAAVVQGLVKDQQEQPVVAAQISFMRTEIETATERRAVPTPVGKSLADGSFSLVLEPGNYTVQAVKRPHSSGRLFNVELIAGANAPLEIQLSQLEAVVVLSGRVTGEDGDPVGGALVRIGRREGRWTEVINSSRTDPDGRFRLEVSPESSIQVDVSASGYQSTSRKLELTRSISENFVLEKFRAFSVEVLDITGQPIEDARVHGRSQQGQYVLGRFPDGRYYSSSYPFRIFADALDRNQGVSEVVTVATYTPEIRLQISAGGQLQGWVSDPAGGPVKSFTLFLVHNELGSLRKSFNREDGSFQLGNLPSGRFTVKLRSAGFQETTRQVTLRPDELHHMDVTLPPAPAKGFVAKSRR